MVAKLAIEVVLLGGACFTGSNFWWQTHHDILSHPVKTFGKPSFLFMFHVFFAGDQPPSAAIDSLHLALSSHCTLLSDENHHKIAKFVNITPITMVYGIYNYSYWGFC